MSSMYQKRLILHLYSNKISAKRRLDAKCMTNIQQEQFGRVGKMVFLYIRTRQISNRKLSVHGTLNFGKWSPKINIIKILIIFFQKFKGFKFSIQVCPCEVGLRYLRPDHCGARRGVCGGDLTDSDREGAQILPRGRSREYYSKSEKDKEASHERQPSDTIVNIR